MNQYSYDQRIKGIISMRLFEKRKVYLLVFQKCASSEVHFISKRNNKVALANWEQKY